MGNSGNDFALNLDVARMERTVKTLAEQVNIRPDMGYCSAIRAKEANAAIPRKHYRQN